MIIKVYPAIIPSDLKLSRNIRKNIRHTDNRPLDETDLSQYDRKTIFYDVFFNPSNTILYALGPPLLNLEHELSPIVVSVNSDEVKFEQIKFSKVQLNLLQIKFSNKALQRLLNKENNIRINFGKKWIWQACIPLNEPEDKAILTLASMQKNNKLSWIKDWIRYYKEVHGVDRVILYDNGSDYQSNLDQELNIPNLHIVPWNFLFGPTRSHHNKFCQAGSLNHCRLKFPNNKFCLNFDVDEVLVIKDKEKLFNKLNQYGVVYFDGIDVPFVKPNKEDYSYSDFVLRKQVTRSEQGYKAYKYAYKFLNISENSTHMALSNTHGPVIKNIGKFFRKLDKFLNHYFQFSLNSLIPYDLEFNDSYRFDVKDAYFLNFFGITTNWKLSYWNRLRERKETSDLIEDRSIADFFEK